jgi:ATP-dependent helicase YprA (DUF1998 family)
MTQDLQSLISDLEIRVSDAIVSRTRIVNAPLRQFVRERLSRSAGSKGALLAEPVFESAFDWERERQTLQEIADRGHLNAALLRSLGQEEPIDPSIRDSRNTFPKDRRPFTHQLETWRILAEKEPKSVVVSSGTGSGKTEAFLVPVLNDLATQQEEIGRLVGVQALMLYPLNALIASQQDRLADWTEPFSGNIRFCLYNGLTPDRVADATQRDTPWEVRDRRGLRASPPPILVTNATMLEYMLIRSSDAPILTASQGRLRWVILDEAHTYMGSQAAEMTLLLRRALNAFGVRPGDVRFVATSATLGGGEGARRELRSFLADLAGTDESSVEVVEGKRRVPLIDAGKDDYGGIARDPQALRLRSVLAERPGTLGELTKDGARAGALEKLQACVRASSKDGDTFLPLRLHLFLRAHSGIWACTNAACAGRKQDQLSVPEWPYGKLFERDTPTCDVCHSITCEVLLCEDCGSPFLDAATDVGLRRLERWREERAFDEFAIDADETEAVEEGEHGEVSSRHLLGPTRFAGGSRIALNCITGELSDRQTADTSPWALFERQHCPCCGAGSSNRTLFRSLRLGGPFLAASAANVLLDHAPERKPAEVGLPYNGRQLISFTDNRQGTARFAAKWQQDSERSFFRSTIFHALQDGNRSNDPEIERLKNSIQQLEEAAGGNQAVKQVRDSMIAQLATMQANGGTKSWSELRSALAAANRDQPELLRLWSERDPRFDNADELATLQLFSEFLRRPVRTNSLETLGGSAIRFAGVDRLADADLPPLFREKGATIGDWQDYLYLLLTYFLRANSVVHIDDGLRWWVGQRVAPKSAHSPDYEGAAARGHIRWPAVLGAGGRSSRPVLLLRDGFGLDLDEKAVREQVNETLRMAYRQLSPVRLGAAAEFKLDLTKASFARVGKAWLCPVTGRILDRAFRGLTPFLPQIQGSRTVKCREIEMPELIAPWVRNEVGEDAREVVSQWLRTAPSIVELRAQGVWTDLHDRLALRNPFVRVVEHSAQQLSDRLRRFERDFKLGRLNVLCCSTTMEMGVDIGGLSTVMMTNVPPSAANYRQRVGRAGRRGEPLSTAFSYCPDSPLGWSTFDEPKSPLSAEIRAPRVALESRPIVQRHVNAFLLGKFLRSEALPGKGDRTGLEAGWFFEAPAGDSAPYDRFVAFLRALGAERGEIDRSLGLIVSRTALSNHPDLYERCIDAIAPLANLWREECSSLRGDIEATTDTAAKKSLEKQLERLTKEFLLKHLAQSGFLPGHGFPTDVVPFVVLSPAELRAQDRAFRDDDGSSRTRGFPSRQLDQAIREYAPGADIVLDGLVYESAGITLNWKRPAGESDASEIQSLSWFWRCSACSTAGSAHGRPDLCSNCGSERLARDHVLRPSGFSVDTAQQPNNDIEHVSYVPPSRPTVALRGLSWASLENPELGRHRGSPDGRIMALSRGMHGCGYAVCLMCGRAAPETARPIAGEALQLPGALDQHRSLRRRKAKSSLRCEGTDKPFAIQRNLSLGYARQTDVFELQLSDISTRSLAVTVTLALREALARRLGVERDEIGWLTEEVPGPEGKTAWSMFLYDTASGGAGYASTAGTDLTELLRASRAYLDCRNPGCLTGCPACLVVRDSAQDVDSIDRRAAIPILESIVGRLVLPAKDRVFGAKVEQRTSSVPVATAIDQTMAARPDGELLLYLSADVREWDFASWWAMPFIERFGRQGRSISIVLPAQTDAQIPFSVALSMQGLMERAAGKVKYCRSAGAIAPKTLLAAVRDGRGSTAWALLEAKQEAGGPQEAEPDTVVRADNPVLPELGRELDLAMYLQRLAGQTFRLDIGPDLDGPVPGFGTAFWRKVLAVSPQCQAAFNPQRAVKSFTYSDRYLFSPLSVRLLYEVLKIATRGGQDGRKVPMVIRTQGERRDSRGGYTDQINHDWGNASVRKAVLEAVMARAGVQATVRLEDLRSLAHGRTLDIEYDDGGRVEILFDQGLGYWKVRGRVPFDFNANVPRQAEALARAPVTVAGDRQYRTTVIIDLQKSSNR